MAYPIVQSADSKTKTEASGSTSHTMDWPTNLASGDLVVFIVHITASGITISGLPTGMVAIPTLQSTNPQTRNSSTGAMYFYTADGTESGTFSFSTSASARLGMVAYRISEWDAGWTGGDEVVLTGASQGAGSSPAVATGGIAVPWGSADNLFVFAIVYDSIPTGLTPAYSNNNFTLTGHGKAMMACTLLTTSDGPGGTWGSSLSNWVRFRCGIKPGTSGGNPTWTPYAQAVLVG